MKKRKQKAPPKNRTRYEGELVKLLSEQRKDYFIFTSGATRGWDVQCVKSRGKKFIPIEVKTSSATKNINLAYIPRVKKQYDNYNNLWKRYKVITWYAFRYISRGRKTKETKWRFVPLNNINQMVLSFEDGLTLKEFAKVIL
jgi:hypothetical protein